VDSAGIECPFSPNSFSTVDQIAKNWTSLQAQNRVFLFRRDGQNAVCGYFRERTPAWCLVSVKSVRDRLTVTSDEASHQASIKSIGQTAVIGSESKRGKGRNVSMF